MDQLYSLHVFSKALVHTVCRDNAQELLECLVAYCPNGFASKGMEEAALLAKLGMMRWLVGNCPNLMWSARFTDNAASAGHLDALKWLKEFAGTDRQWCLAAAIQHAAFSGHLATVQWLHENVDRELVFDTRLVHEARTMHDTILGGHFEIVKYLHTHDYNTRMAGCTIDLAVRTGKLELVEWLHENIWRVYTEISFEVAAENGMVDVTRWLLKHPQRRRPRHHNLTIQAAAKSGHLEIIQLLQEFASSSCYERALTNAAQSGHFDVVQWLFSNLRENSYSDPEDAVGDSAVSHAAENGHMVIAQWLYSQRTSAQRPSYEIAMAASNGRLSAVQWITDRSYQCYPVVAIRKAV